MLSDSEADGSLQGETAEHVEILTGQRSIASHRDDAVAMVPCGDGDRHEGFGEGASDTGDCCRDLLDRIDEQRTTGAVDLGEQWLVIGDGPLGLVGREAVLSGDGPTEVASAP